LLGGVELLEMLLKFRIRNFDPFEKISEIPVLKVVGISGLFI
jgi:hypothetical protein